jgi:hypothetical protein
MQLLHAARGVGADGSGAGKWMNRWRMRLGLWEYSEFSIGSHAGWRGGGGGGGGGNVFSQSLQ